MRRILFLLLASFAQFSAFAQFSYQGNPLVRDKFTADPAPMVWNDRLYLYVGHDEWYEGQDKAGGGKEFNITEWLCYSTDDMKTWTDHGSVLRPGHFAWGDTITAGVGTAWAAQVVPYKGKFYYYTTLQGKGDNSGYAIGVAVADNPTGPFKDAIGKPLVNDKMTPNGKRGWWNDIDPTVLIDDDGQAYLCWGNGTCFMAKLKDNMIELASDIWTVDLPRYTEGPWLHKYNGNYYLTYASSGFDHKEAIDYAMSKSINGPWTHKGQLTGGAENSFTIHPGIVNFKGHWYLFYHNATLTLDGHKGAIGRRSVCFDEMVYNADGTMQYVNQSKIVEKP
ncbi:MAG: glycoside hydrolase family 43 protein [Prevotella sp.]|nr:glycoside hydrolase family 43 protein [Candidatus Prevotella equi]